MPPLDYAVVASGANVSGNVDLSQRRLDAIFVPTLPVSGTLTLQGNVDTTSAGFRRMLEMRQPGSGDLQVAVGVGSRFIPWFDDWPTPAFGRFEFITAAGSFQTSPVTLTLVTRPR